MTGRATTSLSLPASATSLALRLVWLAHVGQDRLLGYGLKYDAHFQHTHLGRPGRHTGQAS
jgi:hypothetical protein